MRNIILSLMFVVLTGCANFIETKVSIFHELESSLSKVTYALVPTKEQEDSLEYQSYANLVKIELEKRGMTEAPYNQAKYAIFMFYGIDNGKEVITSYPIVGPTGTGSSYTSGTVNSYGNMATYSGTTHYLPTYGVVGTGSMSDTVFTRYLNIDIINIANSGNGKVKKVYEGKAISLGATGQLVSVMPAIVKSVFEDFPGKSGSSRTIQQPFEK